VTWAENIYRSFNGSWANHASTRLAGTFDVPKFSKILPKPPSCGQQLRAPLKFFNQPSFPSKTKQATLQIAPPSALSLSQRRKNGILPLLLAVRANLPPSNKLV
jgi:hypothetical protein